MGGIPPTDIRDLIGMMASEVGVKLTGFISVKEPSKAMRAASVTADQIPLAV